MQRLLPLLAVWLSSGALSGCRLPRNQAEVMHGKVQGGEVPLYKTGSIDEFYRAGLILPDVGGYVRAEFDVLNVQGDGSVSTSSGGRGKGAGTVAQVAIPRLVSSYDLSRSNVEMRAAAPAAGAAGSAAVGEVPAPAPSAIAAAPVAPRLPQAAPTPLPVRPAPLVMAAAPVPSLPAVKDLWASNPYVAPLVGAGQAGAAVSGGEPDWKEGTAAAGASLVASRASAPLPSEVPWAVSSGFHVASLP